MGQTIQLEIAARRFASMYLFTVPIGIFSLYAIISSLSIYEKKDIPLFGMIFFSLFQILFAYMAFTSIVAFLWMLIGKEKITAADDFIRIEKRLLFRFSSKQYHRQEIKNPYINSEDYLFNKVSRGRNDFLSVFRIGTIHFNYRGKLIHIAGGMTEAEAKAFCLSAGLLSNNQ